jgi:hypothetical protein
MTDSPNPSPDRAEPGLVTDERRQGGRDDTQVSITVKVATDEFVGRTQNVSQAGVFFFSGDQLRVTVEMEQDGERVHREGHLVRVERMNDETTGFAIEFDHQ